MLEITLQSVGTIALLYLFFKFAKWVKARFSNEYQYESYEQQLQNKIDALFDDIDDYKKVLRKKDDSLRNLELELTDTSIKLCDTEARVFNLTKDKETLVRELKEEKGQSQFYKHLYENELDNHKVSLDTITELRNDYKTLQANCDGSQELIRRLELEKDELQERINIYESRLAV